MNYKVLVIGDINIDAVVTAKEYPPEGGEALVEKTNFRLGGSGCNTAVTLAKLGAKTWLAGNLGTDPLGTMAMTYLIQSGVQLGLVQQKEKYQTGFFCIVVTGQGERTMFGSRGSNALPPDAEKTNQLLTGMTHLHISGYTLIDDHQSSVILQLAKQARKFDIPISLDPGVCTAKEYQHKINDFLPMTEYILISQTELNGYSGNANVENGIQQLLGRGVKTVVLKRGIEGSQFINQDERFTQAAFHHISHAIQDTTGAGDAFNAGFLFARLNNLSETDCLTLGNLCAFRSITSLHGTVDICQEEKYPASLSSLLKEYMDRDNRYETLEVFLETIQGM